MKKYILMFFCLLYFTSNVLSQVIYSNKIDSILSLVSIQSISRMNKELSGDTIVTIGGIPQILISRAWNSQGNIKAAQYIYEKFMSYGLNPKYMVTTETNKNVYAVKTGTLYPNKKIIIGAHYDDLLYNVYPNPTDTMHGADDNASGVCGVLESARLLSGMSFPFTIIFVAFDEEEAPAILSGSKAFADSCFMHGDSIISVFNMDMIGWDGNNDNKFVVLSDSNSYFIHRVLYNCLQAYQINLNFVLYGEQWDESSFQNRGYRAITLAEEARNYFNPYYHTINDRFDKFNVPYFQKMVKAVIAALMTYAMNLHIDILHTQLLSTPIDTNRIAKAYILYPNNIATGINAPRLYYKVNNGTYNFIYPYNISGEEYYFSIPGFPIGTKITYYIAAQDTNAVFMYTIPSGGSGVNPPGTVPPQSPYVYYVLSTFSQFSQTFPKTINDLQITTDTIHVLQNGNIKEVKVTLNINHNNDGDIFVKLNSHSKTAILTQYNGINGQNYTNTIFDDTAYRSITQGIPPFTGRYKPQSQLAIFNNSQLSGEWILMIYDKNQGNQGTLLNWGLQIVYENTIGVKSISEEIPEQFILFQNYPNPFNPATNIKYQIAKNSFVSLKVYDILGREIANLVNEFQTAGIYETQFPNSLIINNQLTSGIYFYRLKAGDFSDVKRMLLIK